MPCTGPEKRSLIFSKGRSFKPRTSGRVIRHAAIFGQVGIALGASPPSRLAPSLSVKRYQSIDMRIARDYVPDVLYYTLDHWTHNH